ncbi:unnamed protein product [Parnassius apollo]|uniref:(apollo) hypothetical protein n=1 Tax=Parnassius apollo TaxID=110799 RepID=A0A8S3WUQ4_PARAO|nr:unnamed protein product [Parnassius apollo]
MVADAHVGTDESEEEGSMSSDEEIFVSTRSRKRRIVIYSDDNTSDIGQLGSESIQHQQEPQEPESSFVIRSNKNHLYGKSGYKWSTRPRNPRARTSSRNVIHVVPEPAGVAKEITDPRELFLQFISHEIINEMVTYTNTEIDIKKSKYKQEKYTNSHTSTNEVTALLGLLIQSAAIKSNHLPTRTLFDHKRSAITFKACMSADRFDFLLRCLSFDKTTRTEQRASDKLAPFNLEAFISNCVKCIINAYAVYVCNMIRDHKKPLKRREFALQMADELIKPWLLERYNTVTLQRDVKKSIGDILNIEVPQESCVQELHKTRKICGFC